MVLQSLNGQEAGCFPKYSRYLQFNNSTNPTFVNSGKNVHISELGVYDNVGNLVAIGKFITPIEKTNVTTIILEVALDF